MPVSLHGVNLLKTKRICVV